jgi:hypothetical protein
MCWASSICPACQRRCQQTRTCAFHSLAPVASHAASPCQPCIPSVRCPCSILLASIHVAGDPYRQPVLFRNGNDGFGPLLRQGRLPAELMEMRGKVARSSGSAWVFSRQ